MHINQDLKGEIWNKSNNHTKSSVFIHKKHPNSSNKKMNTNNNPIPRIGKETKRQQDSSNRKTNTRRFVGFLNWETNTRSNSILLLRKQKDGKYLESRI
jgi:hypothetical protein